jgi:two-component system phosphate regulon sensor histidine kinase PhoR|tara:strand:+ start:379 stop:1416 length:1038 start_codon:yes stop_codon:yes gene_type:complete
MQFKKTYKFAFYTSLLIALCSALILGVFFYSQGVAIWYAIPFFLLVFSLSFFVIQHRVQHFIYKRVNKIYEDLTLLESAEFTDKKVTTDMATLTQEIDKYARDKKFEIEALKIRESYRKEFMGNVSHELKTPLFTVQGYVETLLDGAMSDKKITKKYLERASKGVERLIYIVNDLDMLTKLEVGNLVLNKETFNIIESIQSVFDLLEMKATKRKITLTFDRIYKDPIYVYADKERVQQALTNLIVNSIKYGREKGTTEVTVEKLLKNKFIVRVTDNGEGIDKQNLKRVFERFYRVDKSGSRKEGGSGLGLSIVKHIIEAHNERIYVESEHNVGSEFSFTLSKPVE